jgi:hypothetical protein
MDTSALRATLARWAEDWEHTPQGWAAHGLADALRTERGLVTEDRVLTLGRKAAAEHADAYETAFRAGLALRGL